MAKPRVFVSSTYYDLKYIRQAIEVFVEQLGYEPVLFESGDIPFSHDKPLDQSCYREIAACQILVLIIGGRYGAASSEYAQTGSPLGTLLEEQYAYYNSITRKEYETARTEDIPIYVFVEKRVLAEYQTYKSNRNNKSIRYAHVDSVNIFKLLDDIYSEHRNNLVKDFENVDDITSWLRDQWAGLFADFLSRESSSQPLNKLSIQLSNLESIAKALKDYSEQIIQGVSPNQSETIIKDINLKLQQESVLIQVASQPLIAHLLTHRAPFNELLSAFRDAESIIDLTKRLSQVTSCIRLTQLGKANLREINDIRAILGVSAFPQAGEQELEEARLIAVEARVKRRTSRSVQQKTKHNK